MKAMLEGCRKAARSDATFVWVPAAVLETHEVAPWQDMPAWVPGTGETAGFSRIDVRKAVGKGLAFRPIEETATDTLAWWKTLPAERTAKLKAGLDPEKEAKVLAALKK